MTRAPEAFLAADRLNHPPEPPEPLGVIAGGGELPRIVADHASRHGWKPQIIAIGDGITGEWAPHPSHNMPWGKVGDAVGFLEGQGIRRLVLCGTVSVRPDFRSILPSLKTLAFLPQILKVVRGGDDSLLRKAARTFERRGFELMAVQEIVPELLMPRGNLTGSSLSEDEGAALKRGFEASHALGLLDVGQAIVASKDRVIALEGIEGTREMLERVADLRHRGRLGPKERCVLVKGVKPGQDLRFDLPSIGLSTIEEAASAGLAGIALSAGQALIMRVDDVVAAARRHGMFLIGHPVSGGDSGRESP